MENFDFKQFMKELSEECQVLIEMGCMTDTGKMMVEFCVKNKLEKYFE